MPKLIPTKVEQEEARERGIAFGLYWRQKTINFLRRLLFWR